MKIQIDHRALQLPTEWLWWLIPFCSQCSTDCVNHPNGSHKRKQGDSTENRNTNKTTLIDSWPSNLLSPNIYGNVDLPSLFTTCIKRAIWAHTRLINNAKFYFWLTAVFVKLLPLTFRLYFRSLSIKKRDSLAIPLLLPGTRHCNVVRLSSVCVFGSIVLA